VHRYSPKEIKWLEKHIAGRGFAELTELFNRRFGLAQSKSAIRFAASSRGMSHGLRLPHRYTPAQIRFLKKTVPGRSFEEAAKLFNKRFGLRLSRSRITAAARNRGITNGRDGRFRPGQVSHNKGKKGACAPGSEKGWFRPGQMPHNWRPAGTEIVDENGYVKVKTRNPKTWKFKHRLVWEKAYGRIPRGRMVIFADGNRQNFALDNLVLVSKSEHAVMNRLGLRSGNGELTRIGKAVADVKLLIAERERGLKKKPRRKK
jgi:hypothetical protein